jgi:hypothetical protein
MVRPRFNRWGQIPFHFGTSPARRHRWCVQKHTTLRGPDLGPRQIGFADNRFQGKTFRSRRIALKKGEMSRTFSDGASFSRCREGSRQEHHMDRKRDADFGEELAKLDESDKDDREHNKTKEQNEFAVIQCRLAPPLLFE